METSWSDLLESLFKVEANQSTCILIDLLSFNPILTEIQMTFLFEILYRMSASPGFKPKLICLVSDDGFAGKKFIEDKPQVIWLKSSQIFIK